MFPPGRIVCLTEETVETLYLLGEQDRIVGISGYVVRPPQARREKPRVSAFTSANIDKILALRPDLVLTFSDLQANIVADLIRRGLNVHAFNQRASGRCSPTSSSALNAACPAGMTVEVVGLAAGSSMRFSCLKPEPKTRLRPPRAHGPGATSPGTQIGVRPYPLHCAASLGS